MQIVLVDAADIERLHTEVLADTVVDVHDVVARPDLAEMRDTLALRRARRRTTLLMAEDILLRYDDETVSAHLEARAKLAQLDVKTVITQLCALRLHERRQMVSGHKLAHLIRLLLRAEQQQHALLVLQPALGLVLQQIHLALERRHVRSRETHGRIRLRAVNLLQHQRRVDDLMACGHSQQIVPGKGLRLELRILLDRRADGLAQANGLIEDDGAVLAKVAEEYLRLARRIRACQRHDDRVADVANGALRIHVEFTQGVDLIVEELKTHRMLAVDGIDIDDAAACIKLSLCLHLIGRLIAELHETLQQLPALQDIARAHGQGEALEILTAHALLHGCIRRCKHDDGLLTHKTSQNLHTARRTVHAAHRGLYGQHIELRQIQYRHARQQALQVLAPAVQRGQVVHKHHHGLACGQAGREHRMLKSTAQAIRQRLCRLTRQHRLQLTHLPILSQRSK